MDLGSVLWIIGRLCTLLAVLLLAPLLLCLAYGGLGTEVAVAFIVAAAVSLCLGWALQLSFELESESFGFTEAFATVTLCWVAFTVLGSMPFVITGAIPSPLDAAFEALSGFTTTGATVLADPSVLPEPLLFWRAMTHWVGGMGIVALSVAILPALGAGGNFLMQAEAGLEAEKLLPRISSTAKLLWMVYTGLTAAQFLMLWAAGMTPLDAICHTFSTVATGGFGTRADSLNSFSPLVQWITVVFMFLGGVNFVILLNVARGRWRAPLRNSEFRTYAGLIAAASLVATLVLAGRAGGPRALEPLLREATFTTVSILTTTGFSTADYALWPGVLQGLVVLLMFSGGCAGSTAGGAKIVRLLLWAKHGVREVRRLLRPRALFVVKLGGRAISDDIVAQVGGFLVLYLAVFAAGALLLMLLGHHGAASASAVLSCISNVGPGLSDVGPTQTYAGFGPGAKLVLMACMLLGRLEFYSVLVLFLPLAWRR